MTLFYGGDSHDLRIVLLGVSGAGKSPTANAILGREAFRESRTRESEIQRGRVEDRNISIIDTPGFFNTQLTDEEQRKQMMKSLDLSHPGPHVFLLLINLETFEKEERNIVEEIQENFGAQAFKFTIVLFTGREKMTKRAWMVFILNPRFQELVSHCRGQYHAINSKMNIIPAHITKLLEKIDDVIKQNDGQHYDKEICLQSFTKSRKESKKQEKENTDRKNEQEEEFKQEAIKITWDAFKMDRETEAKTANVLTELKKRTLISQVREKDRIQVYEEWVLKRNENERVKQLAKSQRKSFERVEEKTTAQTPQNCSKTSGAGRMQQTETKGELRMVMVGKTGVGKSATGNTILGQKVFKDQMCSESVTKECQQHQQTVDGRKISVIDTPGLFDTSISEEQLKEELVTCVYMSAPGPHVFLLVIRLDVRFTDEEKNTVKWIQENFGKDAARYTIILFTRGDQLKTSIEEFLTKNYQIRELVEQCNGGYHVFNNEDEENRSQVSELLEKIDRMVKDNGGEHYTNEMYKKAQREKILGKMKGVALAGAAVTGAAGAVAGGVALVAATGGVALPAMLVAGGAALTGGTGGKLIVDKVNEYKQKMKKKQQTINEQ